ncbi:uncharacterized protein [Periplaneta americana]|uniref:uncharacterized protein n=1 Tax=Periplaneta americana TaxID=6978 RepID=UPI0037E89C11
MAHGKHVEGVQWRKDGGPDNESIHDTQTCPSDIFNQDSIKVPVCQGLKSGIPPPKTQTSPPEIFNQDSIRVPDCQGLKIRIPPPKTQICPPVIFNQDSIRVPDCQGLKSGIPPPKTQTCPPEIFIQESLRATASDTPTGCILTPAASAPTSGSRHRQRGQDQLNKNVIHYVELLPRSQKKNSNGKGSFKQKKDHLLWPSGGRTKDETSEVFCVESRIVWGKKIGHYNEMAFR